VAAGHILAQDPVPGLRVRRDWPIRITESLGPQRVNVPDLTGNSERAATVSIRRLSLELGVVAHLAVPGDPDVVLTQTPPPNSAGVDGPRVSLLVSDPEDAEPPAYVMPSLIGLPYAEASERAEAAGLHLVAMAPVAPVALAATDTANAAAPGAAPIVRVNPTAGAVSAAAPGSSTATAGTPLVSAAASVPSDAAPYAETAHPSGTITGQTPGPGHRVVQGQAVHVSVGQAGPVVGAVTQSQ
jgi:beta-lactam-binding protein with PASTA domain